MYNTSNPLEAQNLRLRVDKLIEHGEMVELISKKPRSLKANAYLHTILSYFGLQTGNTLEEVKSYYFKRVVNSDLFVRHKHDDILGDDRIISSVYHKADTGRTFACHRPFPKLVCRQSWYLHSVIRRIYRTSSHTARH